MQNLTDIAVTETSRVKKDEQSHDPDGAITVLCNLIVDVGVLRGRTSLFPVSLEGLRPTLFQADLVSYNSVFYTTLIVSYISN